MSLLAAGNLAFFNANGNLDPKTAQAPPRCRLNLESGTCGSICIRSTALYADPKPITVPLSPFRLSKRLNSLTAVIGLVRALSLVEGIKLFNHRYGVR